MFNPTAISPDTAKLYGFLPQFVRDNDQSGGYQFLAWLQGWISEGSDRSSLTYTYDYNDGNPVLLPIPVTVSNSPVPAATGLQAIDDIIRDTPYNPGWSILLDLYRCPTYALPWLGQFVGVRFNTDQLESDATMRQAIQSENSFARGTFGVIQSVADSYLSAGFTADVMERTSFISGVFGIDPYSITITFALAGVNSLTYGQLFSEYASYAAVESHFATYEDMRGNIDNLENGVLAAVPAGDFVYFNGT